MREILVDMILKLSFSPRIIFFHHIAFPRPKSQKNPNGNFPLKTVLFGVIKQSTEVKKRVEETEMEVCVSSAVGLFFVEEKSERKRASPSCCVSVPQVDKEGDLEGRHCWRK